MKNTRAPLLLLALYLTALPVFYACEKAQEQILVESISLNKTSAELVEGESISLTAKIAPSNATNKNISWKSDNVGVATVDQNGNVTAIKAGKATISVISEEGGKSATCVVTVKAKVIIVSSVTLSKTSVSLKVGETITLEAKVNPDDATDKTVSWSSTDDDIAIVSNGVVIAKKIGSATITAKAGEKTASCAILVEATSVTSISIDKTSASLKVGETVTLTATVNPDDATDKMVSWTTSDATVATVDNGVVTAKKVGTATITAKAGDKTATCTITVEPFYVTSISLDQTNITLNIGESQTLKATITPENATDKMVIWTSSNSSVATVDNNGKVSAVKAGNTTITATTQDGGKTATCSVKVNSDGINVGIDDWGDGDNIGGEVG